MKFNEDIIFILESMPDAVIIINNKGEISYLNAQCEKLFGYSRLELLGKVLEKLMPERYGAKHQLHRANYFKNPHIRPMGKGRDLYGLNKDGKEFSVDISLSPLKTEEGLWALAAIRNITERKDFEQTLQQKNQELQNSIQEVQLQTAKRLEAMEQAKELERHRAETAEIYREDLIRFFNTLCHEIRNPLNGIYGSIDLVNGALLKIEAFSRSVEIILDQASKALFKQYLDELKDLADTLSICARQQKVIVDEVLEFSRLKSGKVILNDVRFNPKEVITTVIRMFTPQLTQKKLAITLNLPSEDFWVEGDSTRFTQIVTNLVSNAVKFTPQGGITVKLTYRLLSDANDKVELAISVLDTGIGMTSQEQQQLFKEFSQAYPQIAIQYGGSGLGLSIVKKLVELMGGHIEVHSEKDKGSQFDFTVHCKKLQLQQRISIDTTQLSEQQVTAVEPKNILIVDDNVISQKILSKYLQQAGHFYKIASNGKEAIELCHQYKFDIIFMDIEMPEMDGLEATRKIRELEQAKHFTPKLIIGTSAHIHQEQKNIALSVGMNDYLIKPYEKEKIYDIIKQWTLVPHKSAIPKQEILSETKAAVMPARTWMPKLFRKCLYPILDALSDVLRSLKIPMVMPAARFQANSSSTGWQLYSITGNDEHWAVLNLVHEKDVDNLMAAINQSKAQLSTKKMKSGPAHAIVIVFSSQITLSTEIEKIIPLIQALSSAKRYVALVKEIQTKFCHSGLLKR